MERLLSALANPTRLQILVWLLRDGPMRQVEIVSRLAILRSVEVNPGEVSALLKPLLDQRVIQRERGRPRAPLEVRDREHLSRLLQAAAALELHTAETGLVAARDQSDELRRALLQELPADEAKRRE